MTDQKCEFPACGEAATTVIDGHGLCGNFHHRDHREEVPLKRCAVIGCDYPANGASAWCIHHARAWQRPAATGEAA